ncbi:MAG TPA: hypothetical protein VGO87_05955 [Acidimicrobiia bacterium]|jgi:hypothetical protein
MVSDDRLDRIEQTLDQNFTRIDERFTRIDERFTHVDQTIDRLLALAMDHGAAIGRLEGSVADIRADQHQMRIALDGIQEGFREHLTWHLGQQ